jgi:hypothetical protein
MTARTQNGVLNKKTFLGLVIFVSKVTDEEGSTRSATLSGRRSQRKEKKRMKT